MKALEQLELVKSKISLIYIANKNEQKVLNTKLSMFDIVSKETMKTIKNKGFKTIRNVLKATDKKIEQFNEKIQFELLLVQLATQSVLEQGL